MPNTNLTFSNELPFAAFTGKREDFSRAVSFAIGVFGGAAYNNLRLDLLHIH